MTETFEIARKDPEKLWSVYQTLGSVHRAGKVFGVSGDLIHKTLLRAGYRFNNHLWSDDEILRLREYYTDTPAAQFSLDEITTRLGRTRASVALKASKLGLSDRNRPMNESTIKRMSGARKEWYKTHRHHSKGMKRPSIPLAQRQRISASLKDTFAKQKQQGTGMFSPESRQKRSDSRAKFLAIKSQGYCYSSGSSGCRVDLGDIYFRSRWEANTARYLNWLKDRKVILGWEYEPDTFWLQERVGGGRHYTPDFKIFPVDGSEPYYWEVKGWMNKKSRTKLALMAELHPLVKLLVVDSSLYRKMERKVSHLLDYWETGNNKISPLYCPLKYCLFCRRAFTGSRVSDYCSKLCINTHKRELKRPSKSALMQMLSTATAAQVGAELGVSGATIMLWAKDYGVGLQSLDRSKRPKTPRRSRIGTSRWVAENDWSGKRFGSWYVLRLSERRGTGGRIYWVCECKCGRIIDVLAASLITEKSTQCRKCSFKRSNGRITVHPATVSDHFKTVVRLTTE